MPISSFVALLRILLAGDEVLPRDLVRPAPPQLPAPSPRSAPPDLTQIRLTPREAEVLALVAAGQRNKLIARRLQLSEHTVKLHIHNIISKLGATNRTEAAQWYHGPRSRTAGGQDE
ncbi:DNA-binding response regulator [Falsigemmobacter faecalis]|uniref:DNA-binding response regulator n=2 Tax=Falsigemmobacter faecalis TaxID=2488730 RepID=A0A3P3D502_9RHOB|nr:DNA-binding response regulator [Falsigemmobacter faecalis]